MRALVILVLLLGFVLVGTESSAADSKPRKQSVVAPLPDEPEVASIYSGGFKHEFFASGASGVVSNGQETRAVKEKVTRAQLDLDDRYQIFKNVQIGTLLDVTNISSKSSITCAAGYFTFSYNMAPTEPSPLFSILS